MSGTSSFKAIITDGVIGRSHRNLWFAVFIYDCTFKKIFSCNVKHWEESLLGTIIRGSVTSALIAKRLDSPVVWGDGESKMDGAITLAVSYNLLCINCSTKEMQHGLQSSARQTWMAHICWTNCEGTVLTFGKYAYSSKMRIQLVVFTLLSTRYNMIIADL